MFGRLLPVSTNFFDYFENHASLIVQATNEFVILVSDGADIQSQAIRIKVLEHAADTVTHLCVEAVHKTFITPFERNDIYQLITQMDDIIDYVNEISARIVIYKLKNMTPEVKSLAAILNHSVKELELIVKTLRKIGDINAVRERFKTIKRYENESDVLLRKAVGRLFDTEKEVANIIKWKEIYENLEEAVNRCEDVSNIVEGVILEMS